MTWYAAMRMCSFADSTPPARSCLLEDRSNLTMFVSLVFRLA